MRDYDPFGAEDFKSFVESTMRAYHAPGVSIAVVHKDRTFTAAYGYASLETREPVTPHTMFYGASTTKSFTAALASKLVYSSADDESVPSKSSASVAGRKKVDWTTPLSELLPGEFMLQDEYATKHATMVDALSHRTGLPAHDMIWLNGRPSLRETTRLLRHVAPNKTFRASWEYTNVMYTVVAHALETVTGKTTNDLLHEWLWKPLGMNESAYSIEKARELAASTDNETNMARGYLYNETTQQQYAVPWDAFPSADGSGGVASSALDYAKWIQAFLRPIQGSTLDPECVEYMTQAHMPSPPGSRPGITDQGSYGLGLRSGIYRGFKMIEHSGGDPGFMTQIRWIPELDWGFVVFTNSYDFAQMVLTARLTDDFLQTPQTERFDIPAYIAGLKKMKIEEATTALSERKAKIKKQLSPALPIGEYQGQYQHPAYGTLTVSSKLTREESDELPKDSSSRLYFVPAGPSTSDWWGMLDHVNGDHWLAWQIVGVRKWQTDKFMDAQFVVGLDGRVKGLRLHVETTLDELAMFERVA